MEREVSIAGRRWKISGDDSYASNLGEAFEPHLVALIAWLCDEGSNVLDIGANIGCTALALSQIVGDTGKVAAVEPVPRTFAHLSRNLHGVPNVTLHNFAFGKTPGTVPMQGSDNNLSGAFIADQFTIEQSNHFTVQVPVRTVDEAIQEIGLDRLDFIKIDVEGFELDVLEGASETLQRYKPRVVLEMNHFCLNQFRRITIPEFRERLLAIFPYAYAIEGTEYLDFTDEKDAYTISYHHLVNMRYANIAAGFNKTDLLRRLASLNGTRRSNAVQEQLREERATSEQECVSLREQLARSDRLFREANDQKNALLASSSWRITKPLRAVKRLITGT